MAGATVECLLCSKRFTLEQILNDEFFVVTCICRECYAKLQSKPQTISCFGKSDCYDSESLACSSLCPDITPCKQFIEESKMRKHRKVITVDEAARKKAARLLTHKDEYPRQRDLPFRETSIIGQAYALCVDGCTVKQMDKFIKQTGCNRQWLLRNLRRESIHGFVWTWKEDGEHYKIIPA